jgi:hypothetical protein
MQIPIRHSLAIKLIQIVRGCSNWIALGRKVSQTQSEGGSCSVGEGLVVKTEINRDSAVPSHRITNRDPEELAETKKMAKEGYERAMRERQEEGITGDCHRL